MKLILLGSPGAGKGTQADFLCEKFNIVKICASALLHDAVAKGNVSCDVKAVMERGELAPDEVIINLIKRRISEADCKNGYLLDGFPRTIPQSKALLESGIEINYVIEIVISDDEVIRRLTGRRVHPGSGRVYHVIFNPPNVPDKDDITGEPLVKRDDDNEETIRKRLEIYHRQTEPLRIFYKELMSKYSKPVFISLDGNGSVGEVRDKLSTLL